MYIQVHLDNFPLPGTLRHHALKRLNFKGLEEAVHHFPEFGMGVAYVGSEIRKTPLTERNTS
jgi:hypothetical protein